MGAKCWIIKGSYDNDYPNTKSGSTDYYYIHAYSHILMLVVWDNQSLSVYGNTSTVDTKIL